MLKIAEGVLYTAERLKQEKIQITGRVLHEVLYFALPGKFREKFFVPGRLGPHCETIQEVILALDFNGIFDYDEANDTIKMIGKISFPNRKDILQSKIDRFLVELKGKNFLIPEKINILSKVCMISVANREESERGGVWKIYNRKAPFLGWKKISNNKQRFFPNAEGIASLAE